MMAGVLPLEIIGIKENGVGRRWQSQGKGAHGGSVGSGNSATVSIYLFFITSTDAIMRRPVVSSLIMESLVGGRGSLCPLPWSV